MRDERIQHVIVLMLENRSFDHMLGFLGPVHPNKGMRALKGDETNPDGDGKPVRVSDQATPRVVADSNHSHAGVIEQVLGRHVPEPKPPYAITMQGFVTSNSDADGRYSKNAVMQCFRPDRTLGRLALEFAVCDRWFCSVPGETWPNRQYAHAGTSHGTVDIEVKLYTDPTIFEQLNGSWRVYHEGPAQVWAYRKLWSKGSGDHFHGHDALISDIGSGDLPSYAFVEPDHGLVFRDWFDRSNSQHPHNNAMSDRDFLAGEELIRSIYEALRRNRTLFEKTLFVVTYDEHGGFFDHEHPPAGQAPAIAPDEHRPKNGFAFDLLGPRVPTVLISPWIRQHCVDSQIYDHSAIPATLLQLFVPGTRNLGRRVAVSATFPDRACWLDAPRAELPTLDQPEPLARAARRRERVDPDASREPRNAFQQSLITLAQQIDEEFDAELGSAPVRRRRVERGAPSLGTAREQSEFLERMQEKIRRR